MSKTSPGAAIGAGFVAAIAAALAQLGLCYGLAIVIWHDASLAEWAAHLSWAAWLTAVSTIIGSLIATRLAAETSTRIIAVIAAGIGGFVVAPLFAVPAMRFAEATIATAPFAAAGIGAVAGIVIAGFALTWRVIGINVLATIAATWVLAALAVFVPVGPDSTGPIRLGVWGSWPQLIPEVTPPLLILAAIIGAAGAWTARSTTGAQHRIAAVSGVGGPLLVVVGYAAAWQPDVGVDRDWSGIWIGGYAALAGLLGSLLVAALSGGAPRSKPAATADDSAPAPATARQSDTVMIDPDPEPEPEPTAAPTYQIPVQTSTAQVNAYVSQDYDPYDAEALGEFAEEPPADQTVYLDDAQFTDDEGSVSDATPSGTTAEPQVPQQASPADDTESWVSDLKDDNAFAEQRDRDDAARKQSDTAEPEENTDSAETDAKPAKKRRPRKKKTD